MVQIIGALPEGATFSDIYNEQLGKDLVGAGRQFAQGLSFSSADEIEAYLRSVMGDKSYSENLNVIRENLKKFDEENPEASTASFFAGVLPTLAITAPAAITRLGVMAGSATIGALGGFTEGFLSGEGAYDRTATGASQGILGALLGPVIAKGVQFTPKVIDFAKNLKNKLTPNLDEVIDPIDRTKTGFTFKEIKLLTPLLSKSENRRISQGMVSPEIVTLPIRRMNAQQAKVNPDFDTTESSIAELPLVYKKNNELFVSDGHHRLTKLASEGNQNAKVRLVDLDPPTTTPLLDYNPNTLKEDEELLKELGLEPVEPKVVKFATSLKNKLTPDNLTPKQQTTQLFIDFIKTARKEGQELTEDQKNFVSDLAQRLDYEYLMKNYDLPMDKKSRMERAKALGFDIDDLFYRGRFSGSDPQELGPTLGKEVYMSKSPFVASSYTENNEGVAGEIAELITTKRLNPQVVTIDAKGENFNVLPVDEMTVSIDGGKSQKFTEVFPELIKTPKGTKVDTVTTDDIAFYLRNVSQSDGRPRFLDFDNVIDRGGKGGFYDLQENLNKSLGIPKTTGPIRSDDIAVKELDTPQSERVLINNPQSARYTRAIFDPLLKDINNLRFGIPLGVLPFVDDGKTPE